MPAACPPTVPSSTAETPPLHTLCCLHITCLVCVAQPALLPSLLRRWELPKKEMADLATAVRKLARVLWALHVTFQQVRLPGRTCNLEPAHVLWPLIVTSSRSLCLPEHAWQRLQSCIVRTAQDGHRPGWQHSLPPSAWQLVHVCTAGTACDHGHPAGAGPAGRVEPVWLPMHSCIVGPALDVSSGSSS